MNTHYTSEKNVQIILSLLKQNNISKVVASPGTTNITIVASMQSDPFFEMYSAADERSAGYIACGLSAESGEPVVLTCTGATASRNYLPAMTEAYYRKLPIIAITATQFEGKIGHYFPQVIDRSEVQKDIAVFNTYIGTVKDDEDYRMATIRANQAFISLYRRGGGPIHIDLETHYSRDFSVVDLPVAKKINYYDTESELPQIPKGQILIFVGNHPIWKQDDVKLVDKFCAQYNAIVVCDHTSNYNGKYVVNASLLEQASILTNIKPVLRIHIGYVSADYPGLSFSGKVPKEWRVNKDGEIRDAMGNSDSVFEMSEHFFFAHYATKEGKHTEFLDICNEGYNEVYDRIPELPFSNIWIAKQISSKIPKESFIHFGILNSIRSWNMFKMDDSVLGFCNSGGFGIDGDMSSAIGASLANPDKLHFLIIGDLAFFYDMNSLGNRHIGNNLRIMLINNGCGTEFKNFNHFAASFGDDGSPYMAAMGHYGNKSKQLVKHYAEDLGFHYLSAINKQEFLNVYPVFLDAEREESMILEVFTNWQDESDALKMILNCGPFDKRFKSRIASFLPGGAKNVIKNIFGKE